MVPQIIILGSGFIGSNLAQTFDEKKINYQVFGSAECDLTDIVQVQQVLGDCGVGTTIIMTACVTRLRENSFRSFYQNVLMTENLATFIEANPVRNVVFLSTVDVYGLLEDGQVIDEVLPLVPDDYYAMSKVVSEFILTKCCKSQNIPLAILRLTGVYGIGDEGKSTVWQLVRSAVKRGMISVYGDGSDERDFISIHDVVEVILREIDSPHHHIVNVATGTSFSILEIAKAIAKKIPCNIEKIRKPGEKQPNRTRSMRFDIRKLKTEFPEFTPAVFSEGLRRYLEDYMKNSFLDMDPGLVAPQTVER